MNRHGLRHRAARTETFWAIGGFFAMTVAMAVVVEVWCPHWLDREYALRRGALKERMEEKPASPLLLVVGSSRAVTAFMPERVAPPIDAEGREVVLFNFARLGAGPRLSLVQVHRAIRDGARPSWLIVEVPPPFLVHDDLQVPQASFADVAVLARYPASRPRLIGQSVVGRLSMVHRVRTPFLEWAAPAFVTHPEGDDDPRIRSHGGAAPGWARIDQPTAEQTEHFTRIAISRHKPQMESFRIADHADASMRDLLSLCRDKDIRTVLLLAPEDQQFRSWYGPGVDDRLMNWLGELRTEFGAMIVDGRDWVPDHEFSDPHHVNLKGAERFTARLDTEVIRRLVAGREPRASRP